MKQHFDNDELWTNYIIRLLEAESAKILPFSNVDNGDDMITMESCFYLKTGEDITLLRYINYTFDDMLRSKQARHSDFEKLDLKKLIDTEYVSIRSRYPRNRKPFGFTCHFERDLPAHTAYVTMNLGDASREAVQEALQKGLKQPLEPSLKAILGPLEKYFIQIPCYSPRSSRIGSALEPVKETVPAIDLAYDIAQYIQQKGIDTERRKS